VHPPEVLSLEVVWRLTARGYAAVAPPIPYFPELEFTLPTDLADGKIPSRSNIRRSGASVSVYWS
jgi:hypothetical protein